MEKDRCVYDSMKDYHSGLLVLDVKPYHQGAATASAASLDLSNEARKEAASRERTAESKLLSHGDPSCSFGRCD